MKAGSFELKKWILRLGVEQIALSLEFNEILNEIVEKLKAIKNNKKVTYDESLFEQVLLHILGRNIRKDMKNSAYSSEVLREPFVRSVVKDELCSQIFGQMALSIRKAAVVAVYSSQYKKCFEEIKHIVRTNLKFYLTHKREKGETGSKRSRSRVPEEVLGWFIVATLYRRFTSMVIPCNQLLGGGVGMLGITRVVAPGKSRSSESNMHHDYDVTHRVNVTTPHFDSIRDRRSRASRGEVDSGAEGQDRGGLVQSSIEDEATNISSNFFSSDVEKICEKLQGHSLPESLRGHIWMFCCLHRAWGDPPEGPSRSSELTRLGVQRGMPIESFESHAFSKYASINDSAARQAIAEFTRTTVEQVYMQGFPLRLATFSTGTASTRSRPSSSSVPATPSATPEAYPSFLDKAYVHFLSRPVSPPLSAASALPRVLSESDMSLASTSSSLQDLLPRYPVQAIPVPPHSPDASLLRRAEVLLRAQYILTGGVTKRGAAVALMILISFPDASPISEKILRLFKHVHDDFLPSEQMHHSYSIASTAKTAFALLSKEEPTLYSHVQKVFEQAPDVSAEASTTHTSSQADLRLGATKNAPIRPPAPGALSCSYVLLHPWLETGFVGYLSEFTVMYIWDQCFMLGGRAADWRKVLPVVCVTLLKILKTEIMAERTVEKLKWVIINESKKIRTKIFSMLMRHRIQDLPRKKWFASPFSDTSLALDKIRAVVMLQKLGRGKVDRKKVQDLLQAKQAEKARLATLERSAVKDWAAEIKRQAEEWREEFIRKKEEEEAENALAVHDTLEQLIQKILVAAGTLPERTQAPKVKSAYQIEWEKLMGDGSQSGENNADDDAIKISGRTEDALEEENKEEADTKKSDEVTANDKPSIVESKVNDSDPIQSIDVATASMEDVFSCVFSDIDKKEQQREDISKAEELACREQCSTALKEIVAKVGSIAAQAEAQAEADAKREIRAAAGRERAEGSERRAAEDARIKAEKDAVAALVSAMIDQVDTRAAAAAAAAAAVALVFDSPTKQGDQDKASTSPQPAVVATPEATPETKSEEKDEKKEKAAAALTTAEEEASKQLRASLPAVDVDAVNGFFQNQRDAIHTLRDEKARLKGVISKFRKKFQSKHDGREPTWAEKKAAIGGTYEAYQEVVFNLNTFCVKLRQDEDALLIKWQQKKKKTK